MDIQEYNIKCDYITHEHCNYKIYAPTAETAIEIGRKMFEKAHTAICELQEVHATPTLEAK